jgi:hypothetical protein
MKNSSIISMLVLIFSANFLFAQQPDIQYFRPWNKEGINVFEPSKKATQPAYDGFKLRIGGSFTQDFQSIKHSNKPTYAAVSASNPTNRNFLYGVVKAEDSTSAKLTGFNLAMANLNFDIQIGDGIRVCLENYMSARHHSEFWVKGGYIQIDKLSMFKGNTKWFDDNIRVKIGHFQPNYNDALYRRSDGGNTMFNPFVENYIIDAHTTEIGGEVYVFPVDGFMGMLGLTSGFINGNVENYPEANNSFGVVPTKKTPSVYFKLAYDKQLNPDFRFRLSASLYNNSNIQRNTLFAGDRTGSHYFLAMDPALTAGAATTASAQFTSGRFNPNLSNRVQTVAINPFVKFKGLEFFGSYEIISGSIYGDTLKVAGRDATWEKRKFNQLAVEGIYRFLPNEQAFIAARYVSVTGEPDGAAFKNTDGSRKEIGINRLVFSAGWFPTKNLLLKGEYVSQSYSDFPVNDYRNEGKFSGFMVQAVVGF